MARPRKPIKNSGTKGRVRFAVSRKVPEDYNLNKKGEGMPELLAREGLQYKTKEGVILIGVAWRGDLLMWDTKEERARPVTVYKGQDVIPLKPEEYLDIPEGYIHKKILEREQKMGMRIYSGRFRR